MRYYTPSFALCKGSLLVIFWHLNQTANRVLTESVNHGTISLTVSVNNRRNMLERTLFELPAERQAAMRNAGLEVFAKQNYAKASMEEAARLAGVSKALLFHYFENKRGFYLYLYEYATGLVIREMSAAHDYSETDFFNILINAQLSKSLFCMRTLMRCSLSPTHILKRIPACAPPLRTASAQSLRTAARVFLLGRMLPSCGKAFPRRRCSTSCFGWRTVSCAAEHRNNFRISMRSTMRFWRTLGCSKAIL